MTRKTLQLTMIVLGLLTVVLAGMSLVFGVHNPIYAPATLTEMPALDSNLRFMGGMGLGLGLILLWIVPSIERQTVLFRAVWLCAFLGGLGRLVSIVAIGSPALPMVVFTVIEVVGVPAFIYWQHVVAKMYTSSRN